MIRSAPTKNHEPPPALFISSYPRDSFFAVAGFGLPDRAIQWHGYDWMAEWADRHATAAWRHRRRHLDRWKHRVGSASRKRSRDLESNPGTNPIHNRAQLNDPARLG